MKYIKKFEGLKIDFYSQITFEEFCNFRNPYNLKPFTIEEKNHIEKLLNKSSNIIHHKSSEIFIKTRHRIPHSKIHGFLDKYLHINKLEDEWFAIEKKWFNIDKYIITCYKCDQMDGLLKFLEDERIITQLDIKEGYSMPPDEIQDYFLELTDRDKNEVTIEDKTQEELAFIWKKRHYVGPLPIYLNSKKIDRYLPTKYLAKHNMSTTSSFNPSKDEVTYMMFTINQPRDRIRGNLDVKGYTLDTIKYYLDKFVRYSKVPVNIYVKDIMTNTYNDPLSTSVVRIEFIN